MIRQKIGPPIRLSGSSHVGPGERDALRKACVFEFNDIAGVRLHRISRPQIRFRHNALRFGLRHLFRFRIASRLHPPVAPLLPLSVGPGPVPGAGHVEPSQQRSPSLHRFSTVGFARGGLGSMRPLPSAVPMSRFRRCGPPSFALRCLLRKR
jgi:hypothetical protein